MYEGVVQDLIDELGRLPGVGPKSAQRIAFHILQAEPTDVRRLAQCLMEVKAKVRFCATCGNVAQEELAQTEVDGQAGGGLVRATVTGSGELRDLKIDPKAVDPDDTETLADLIVAAVHAANENAQALQQQKLGPLAQGLGGGSGIPGMPF